jgi:hypothetical protein
MPAKGRRAALPRSQQSLQVTQDALSQLLQGAHSCIVSEHGSAVREFVSAIGDAAEVLGLHTLQMRLGPEHPSQLHAITEALFLEYTKANPKIAALPAREVIGVLREILEFIELDAIVFERGELLDKAVLDAFDPKYAHTAVWLACENCAPLRVIDSPLLAAALWLPGTATGANAPEQTSENDTDDPVAHVHVDLIHTREKTALDALYVDGSVSSLLGLRLSDTCAVIQRGAHDVLHERLKKLGHTPAIRGNNA